MLITGANGFIGKAIYEQYKDWNPLGLMGRKDIDIMNLDKDIQTLVAKVKEHWSESLMVGIRNIVFAHGSIPHTHVIDDCDQIRENFIRDVSAPIRILRVLKIRGMLAPNASVTFLGSSCDGKGSYDMGYFIPKCVVSNRQFLKSISKDFGVRCNTIRLGLVEGSPVEQCMTEDFRMRHKDLMGGDLVSIGSVVRSVNHVISECDLVNSVLDVTRGL